MNKNFTQTLYCCLKLFVQNQNLLDSFKRIIMTEQSTKIAYYIGDENTPYVIKVRF